MIRRTASNRRQAGFGLIEVLVAVVVIAVGLLGIAKMHALSIGNTRVSGSRALAAIYAGSLSSAMHANGAYWQDAGNTTTGVQTSVATNGTIVLSDGTLQALNKDCAGSLACTKQEMAAHDLRGWGLSLRQLPNGIGTVACSQDTATPVNCTITVEWDERYIAATASGQNEEKQRARPKFVALVQP